MHTYFFAMAISLLIVFSGAFPAAGFIVFQKKRESLYRRRSPISRDLLRRAGHSLQVRIDELNNGIQDSLLMLAMIPIFLFATAVTYWLVDSEGAIVEVTMVHSLAAIATMIYFGRNTWSSVLERDKRLRGLDGEIMTGQELDRLMKHGCLVFHDVSTGAVGNIDHVVVSRSGVFSVETKTLGKPEECRDGGVVVDYDAGALVFPDRRVPIPEKQVTRQAEWLSRHLSQRLNAKIPVEPMIALPGWYVERKGRGVCVFNPKDAPAGFFVKQRTELSDRQMQHVVEDLDRLCRDVAPTGKG